VHSIGRTWRPFPHFKNEKTAARTDASKAASLQGSCISTSGFQYRWKLTSILIATETGLPSFVAGSKTPCLDGFDCFLIQSQAERPVRHGCSRGLPSDPTITYRTHVP